MILITVQLVPSGDSRDIEQIGMVSITNDGTGTVEQGNYNYSLTWVKNKKKFTTRGKVTEHWRDQPWWRLLRHVLVDAEGR